MRKAHNLPPSCAVVMKSGNLNFLETSGLVQACNGTDLLLLLARHVLGAYAHHQEHQMLSCSIWFSAPSFWKGDGLESRCVGRVYGADGAAHHTTYAAALKTTLLTPWCRVLL